MFCHQKVQSELTKIKKQFLFPILVGPVGDTKLTSYFSFQKDKWNTRFTIISFITIVVIRIISSNDSNITSTLFFSLICFFTFHSAMCLQFGICFDDFKQVYSTLSQFHYNLCFLLRYCDLCFCYTTSFFISDDNCYV